MAVAKPKKTFVPPKTIGACADLLYTTRQERLVEQKDVAALAERETILKDHIIATLPKSNASGVAGKLARVSVTTNPVPQVTDWEALYKYIKRTGHFDLLQRRLNETAVQERWDAGKAVPGVGTFNVVKVSVNKL